MSQDKKTYFIEIATGEISQTSTSSPWNFKIDATDDEITELREYFDQNYTTGWENFFRAHVPYIQYHYDRQNDAQDETLKKIYGIIYRLGDQEAKTHIEEMGILGENEKLND